MVSPAGNRGRYQTPQGGPRPEGSGHTRGHRTSEGSPFSTNNCRTGATTQIGITQSVAT